MTRYAFPLCTVALLALGSKTAHATIYAVKFCADYSIDFDDADSAVEDDFYISNSDRDALGIHITVERNWDSHDVFSDYTDWSGADAGCTDTQYLDSARTYKVSAQSLAFVNGNHINVYNNDFVSLPYSHVEYLTFSPTASTTITFDTAIADQWNIAAAAGYAMSRRSAGLSGEDFDFYTESCSGGGSCNSAGKIYISSSGSGKKYLIGHEMGHSVARLSNGGAVADTSDAADLDNCYTVDTRDHEANSKEYNGKAANEGIAHYYAAVAFNNTTESSCGFYYYKTSVDWNLDATPDNLIASCESGPMTGVDSFDYLGDLCSGTLTNRAVEWDYLRFFWDLDTDQSVSTTTIFEIWDDSDPESWNATGDGTGSGYPSYELRNAANTNSVLTEWDNEDDDNGVHR